MTSWSKNWNLNSIVSQVNKLKDDVEKQFDEAVNVPSSKSSVVDGKPSVREEKLARNPQPEASNDIKTEIMNDKQVISSVVGAMIDEIVEDMTFPVKEQVDEKDLQLQRALATIAQLYAELSLASSDNGASDEVQRLREALAEKDLKAALLLEEGQTLSMKQSQLEQRLRQLRKEKDQETSAREELETLLEQMQQKYTTLEETLAAIESEKKKIIQQSKSLKEASSSSEKRMKSHLEELEQTESELERLKKENQQLRELHENKSEQILLQSTVEQLQESLARCEREHCIREESLNSQLQDMRKRWQNATNRVDEMGRSVSEATQPLLRQIAALQEDQRARADAWFITEKSLRDRVKAAEQRRNEAEQMKASLDIELVDVTEAKARFEKDISMARKQLEMERNKVTDLTSRHMITQQDLQLTIEQLQGRLNDLESEKRALEGSHRREAADLQKKLDESFDELKTVRDRETKLVQKVQEFQTQIQEYERSKLVPASSEAAVAVTGRFNLEETLSQSDAGTGGNGSFSMFEFEEMRRNLRQREGEVRALQHQLRALELNKKTMADEIVKLSQRNSKLELLAEEQEKTQQELQRISQRHDILLELLGEKEEQLEETEAEFSQVKKMFQTQIDALTK